MLQVTLFNAAAVVITMVLRNTLVYINAVLVRKSMGR